MRIQELERKTGLERPSIRFYEKEGLLVPKRQENGYREYSEDDAELLKKIKLLRRLGMSIEKIRQLQQGSEDLSSAIGNQIGCHSSQIDDHKRCRAVCEAIRDDGAVFASLDADHYLKLLREIRIDDRVLGRTDFQEEIPREIHPWRRWFARWLDYTLWNGIIQFLWIVILRIRPIPGEFGGILLGIFAAASFVPVEALMLHLFGTTPGKFAMGIRLEYIQGGNLPYAEALYRSLRVFVHGTGCAVPLVQPILYTYHFCRLTGRSWRRFARYDEVQKPQEMDWDDQTEFMYFPHAFRRGVTIGLIAAVCLGLTAVTVMDGFKPRYRGDALTVAQISDNYNATMRVLGKDAEYYDKLQEDGSKHPIAPNTVIFDANNSEGHHQMEFSYDVREGKVWSVSVKHEWDRVFYLMPLAREPLQMVCSLLLAQKDCGVVQLQQFINLYNAHLDEKEVNFTFRNIEVQWKILCDKPMLQGIIFADGDEQVTASMDFRVSLIK